MKHISKTVLLLALLAAVTVLAGCTKDAEIPTSPSPGTWGKVQDIPTFPEDPEECFFYSSDGKTVTFHFDEDDKDVAEDFPDIDLNCYTCFTTNPFFSDPGNVAYTGFEATAKKTKGYAGAGYGFIFDYSYDTEGNFLHAFYLELCNSEYRYFCEYYDGTQYHTHYFTNTSNHWLANSHINPVGKENKVKVFTKSNGKIALYINDYLIQEITPPEDYVAYKEALINDHPEYSTGKIFARSGIEYTDYWLDQEVVIKFKFNKLQTQP